VGFVLPDMTGAELIGKLSRRGVECPIILRSTAGPGLRVVLMGNSLGDVAGNPTNRERLEAAVQSALVHPAAPIKVSSAEPEIVRPHQESFSERQLLCFSNEKMRAVSEIIEQVADTDATVLIRGESGVGKELVAHAIHSRSLRRGRHFIKVNCAALPTELLESELFGHEKGAFTGAYRCKPGRFEFANQGTIFLDEIGDLALNLQAKLLHVLHDGEFSRIGGREAIRVNVRAIAATNKDLEDAVKNGQFRKDLYYRLNVVNIFVPPLRERRDDIPLLADLFLRKSNARYNRAMTISSETMQLLCNYAWPGNVRELENIIKRLVVLGSDKTIVQELRGGLIPPVGFERPWSSTGRDLRTVVREAERAAIQRALEEVRGNRAEAARALKVSYKALLYKIERCGVEVKGRRGSPGSKSEGGAA
jgi:two-component system response regulator AtoC